MLPMLVPMFLPAVAGIIARGAAVLGRFAVGAGRAIASAGGGKLGASIGKAAQRAGVAMQRGAQVNAGGTRRGFGGGLGGNPFGQAGGGPGKRRPVTPGRARGRRRRPRQSVSFGQQFTRAVRRGARAAITRQRRGGSTAQNFMQNLFSQNSVMGRVTQNFGSAQANFRSGNKIDGVIDSLKVAGDVAKPMAKGLAILTAGATAAGIAIISFPRIIKDWGASLIESKRHLGEFNATYAIAVGRLDIGRRARNVQLGAATSGSFRSLTQSQNRLEEKLLPYQIQTANGINKVVTVLQEIAIAGTATAEHASNLSPILLTLKNTAKLLNLNGDGAGAENNPLADFAGAMARGNFTRRVRPPMPGGPNALPAGGGVGAGARAGGGMGAADREVIAGWNST